MFRRFFFNRTLLDHMKWAQSVGWFPLVGEGRMSSFYDDGYRFLYYESGWLEVWRTERNKSVVVYTKFVGWKGM